MAMNANSVLVLLAGLCLLSCMGVVSGEHASPTASHTGRGPRGNKPAARGLRKGSSQQLRKDMKEAVDEALGFGHGIHQEGLEDMRKHIEPMWRALSKNQQGRVDRRSFRFVVQRFFMQKHHLSIVGLEANLASDTQSEASLLTQFAPNYVKKVLEGDDAHNGFGMEDAVAMIVALQRLIEHTGTQQLEDVYKSAGMDIRKDVSREAMGQIMEAYMLRWMMGDDLESIQMLEVNETLRDLSFEDWPEIAQFAQGSVTQFEHARQHTGSSSSDWNALRPHFSFADAQTMVGAMALSFGQFWETECTTLKESLLKMDYKSNGRVKISDFHNAALNGEWRFSESKEYLKQMGALDETSTWQGPRVITTNYLQAPSNCIISTEHYRVCCANECQDHLDELEVSIGGPAAIPEEIISIVERLHSGSDDEPRLTSALRSQLKKIAQTHAGKVPIHGRLFAQWMHYVFPLDCPFPHKSGTTTTLTPLAFGDDYMASESEMATHSETKVDESAPAGVDSENEWMSQWSHEEELLTNLVSSSWEADFSTSALGFMIMIGVGILLVKTGIVSTSGKDILPPVGGRLKSHYV